MTFDLAILSQMQFGLINIPNYPKGIQDGIHLHRSIDSFTDTHPIFRQHCKLFFPEHSHYARVILDVVYDHFLAQLWETITQQI